jgi:hypothetical protein
MFYYVVGKESARCYVKRWWVPNLVSSFHFLRIHALQIFYRTIKLFKHLKSWYYSKPIPLKPVTVDERAKACTVFARSEAGIVGSNPTQGMDVWRVYAFILFG